jgi:hypothetical protein
MMVHVCCNGRLVARGTWNPGESPVLVDGDLHGDIENVFKLLNQEYDPILLATDQRALPDAHEVDMPSGHYRVVFDAGTHK